MRILILIFCSMLGLVSCQNSQTRQENDAFLFAGKANKYVLGNLVREGKVSGEVRYNEASGDSAVSLMWQEPFLEVPVDSVYFIYASNEIFKCLLKTRHTREIIYMESNPSGGYKLSEDFGSNVFNLTFTSKNDSTFLKFDVVDIGPVAMGNKLDYHGNCQIASSNRDILFDVRCEEN